MRNLQLKDLSTDTFKIYSASAGSGKTYQLVKSYIKLVVARKSTFKFRQILALTFTNKAVAEMKQRILDCLHDFSLPEPSSNSMFEELCTELQIPASELRSRAKSTLQEILHNYAFFEIITIDKFTHKIIRTFANDLKIPQNFDVVLDFETLLDEAIGKLLNRAGDTEILTKVLIDFSFEKIDASKSWNIAFDLFDIGKLLFEENHKTQLQNFDDKNIDDFLELATKLRSKILAYEKAIKKNAHKTLKIIQANGLETSDFTRGYFPKFMKAIYEESPDINFNASWKQRFGSEKLYAKSCPEATKIKLDGLHYDFTVLFDTIKADFYQLLFFKSCYRNIAPLTVLNELAKEVKAIQQERDILPISEFNSIIGKEIKDQPAPFIYERLGEKYRHYFIDEFQDTSQMQWQNLTPLIGNVLESENEKGEKGSLMIVGDTKQAIYRWRGGHAEQFLNLVNRKTNPFFIAPDIKTLDTNWRSRNEIVHFNNAFFGHIATKLQNKAYETLFLEDSQQKTHQEKGGYVELCFLEKETTDKKNELHCQKTLEVLNRALDQNYTYGDICILVRENNKAVLIADFFAQLGIPVVSPDALLLANNKKILFLISLLRYIENTSDKESAYTVLDCLHQNDGTARHDFISKRLENASTYLKESFDFDIDAIKYLDIYDILELAIAKFDLATTSDAHILHLMDEVFAFSQKEDSGVHAFLDHWERKNQTLNVKVPEAINAVSIMTIHKAKGLEFPVVIFPFADSKILNNRNKKLWIPLEDGVFDGFDALPLNASKDFEHFGMAAKSKYAEELEKTELDAFNVLYVATTRPKNALFIISTLDMARDGSANTDSYAGLLIDFLTKSGMWNSSQSIYTFGNFIENRKKSENIGLFEEVPYTYVSRTKSEVAPLSKTKEFWDEERKKAVDFGEKIHGIIGAIETVKDIDTVNKLLSLDTTMTDHEKRSIETQVVSIINHSVLNRYFQENNIIFNEKEIITPSGFSIRPDRIVFNNQKATLIDYKTGSKSDTHAVQINKYAEVLNAMDIEVERKILVYINKTINPIFI